jgi:hypothetical protein
MTYALRVRPAQADSVQLGSKPAGAGFSRVRRTKADVGELQPELQPLGDQLVPGSLPARLYVVTSLDFY